MDRDLIARRKELLTQRREVLKEEMPHRYAYKWYPWAWDFYTSRNPMILLCAANQISKSSTQIRKCIEWATNKNLWKQLWSTTPNLFWYFYPSRTVASVEFEKKWKQFLPCGSLKNHPEYGWTDEWDRNVIICIHFNSGVSIYFKTYEQSSSVLQSSSVYYVACDEELPEEHYDELQLRLAATGGYFSMAFTATLGQDLWWRSMECIGKENEMFPEAHKIQVSMYDCLYYRDGSPAPWTVDKIKQIEQKCRSQAEILKRVYGRFVLDDNTRTYHTYDPSRHVIFTENTRPPEGWFVYAGVDIGSGGHKNHPAAIIFVAVSPDYKRGLIFLAWRGDKIETTNGDIVEKYRELEATHNLKPIAKMYDPAAKDFGTIQSRLGLGFLKADKSKDVGIGLVNTLFKNDLLKIIDSEETQKLSTELLTDRVSKADTQRKNDLCDALRYAIIGIPWDLTELEIKADIIGKVSNAINNKLSFEETQILLRRGLSPYGEGSDTGNWDEVSQEIGYWNGEYGNSD